MMMKKLRSKIEYTFKELGDFYQKVAKNYYYSFPLLFFSFIGFGFSLFNRSLSVDDIARDLYFGYGKHKIAGMRWGAFLITKVFSGVKYTPFLEKAIGLFFIICASVVFSSILYWLNDHRHNKYTYTIFSCIFVTFPLINEIWEYNESCIPIGFSYLIVSLCLLFQTVNSSLEIVDYLFIGTLMSLVASGSESVFVAYITFTFVILYLKSLKDKKYNWFASGLLYSIPLIISVILRFLIGKAFMAAYGVNFVNNGASGIYWFKYGIKRSLFEIYSNIGFYFERAKHYLPIFEFFIAVILFFARNIALSLKKGINPLLIGTFLVISLYSISILQGCILPLRVAHIFSLFVAFVGYLSASDSDKLKNKCLSAIIIAFLFFVSFRQSVFLHNLLALNNQRSENEARVISEIGYRLYSEYDLEKPVVFCGNYDLGDTIKNQIKNQTETDVQSIINWAIVAFDNQNMMKELFSYYGFEINVLEEPFKTMNIGEYNKIARDNNMKPLEIREFGDYILVYFGR